MNEKCSVREDVARALESVVVGAIGTVRLLAGLNTDRQLSRLKELADEAGMSKELD